MSAQDLFRAGKLEEAIEALNVALRDNPLDARNRTFLFELLCFSGDYARAEKQLDVLERESKEAVLGTLLYRGALNAEKTRQEMFEKRSYRLSPGEPHPRDAIRGSLNGKPFQTIRDADPRIGTRLEVFAAGDYIWISFRDIAAVEMEPPRRLRDLLWAPARLRTGASFQEKDLGEVLLPVLSPLSWQHPDDAVRLGRVSEWCRDENGEESPFGQKALVVDGAEFPLLEVRGLEIYGNEHSP